MTTGDKSFSKPTLGSGVPRARQNLRSYGAVPHHATLFILGWYFLSNFISEPALSNYGFCPFKASALFDYFLTTDWPGESGRCFQISVLCSQLLFTSYFVLAMLYGHLCWARVLLKNKNKAKLVRAPLRMIRSPQHDSTCWDDFQPRSDDIIIATYPRCGTTWTQCIVGMMVFQNDEPFAVNDVSLKLDGPNFLSDDMFAILERQRHRRFLASHLPFDTLPVYEGVKFIHVARDGRDAVMSFHNHKINFKGSSNPIICAAVSLAHFLGFHFGSNPDPAKHFHHWILGYEELPRGGPLSGFWHIEKSYWEARDNPNVLLVHYNDLKTDLEGEMRRIADFLNIEIAKDLWPKLVEAAKYDNMKGNIKDLLPEADRMIKGGGNTFMHKGTNGRWRGVVNQEDLDLYDAKVQEEFSPELADWIEFGRLGGGRNLNRTPR